MAKSSKSKGKSINYSLENITLVDHFIEDSHEVDKDSEKFTYKLGGETSGDTDTGMISIRVSYTFFYLELKLFFIEVLSEFKVTQHTKKIMEDAFNDEKFMRYLFFLSIHHTRGIQSTLIKGKKIDQLYIPIAPDVNLVKKDSQENIPG